MKIPTIIACVLLSACNGSPSQSTAEGTASQASVAGTDSLGADTVKKRPTPRPAVPFVNPTKIGRVLGDKSPSPPASRTH